MAFDQASCRRQEQHCLTLANGASKAIIKTHFTNMATIWHRMARESDLAKTFQGLVEDLYIKESKLISGGSKPSPE